MGHALSEPYVGPCNRAHGHNFEAEFIYEGPVDDRGMVLDFAEFRKIKNWIDEHLDHYFYVQHNHWLLQPYTVGEEQYSPDIQYTGFMPISFNPTSENFAKYLHEVCSEIMNLDSKKLTVKVSETCTSSATYKEE
jgi:6-pyruvoyl-tetrahydropterin synthase